MRGDTVRKNQKDSNSGKILKPQRYSYVRDVFSFLLLALALSWVFYKFLYIPVFEENNSKIGYFCVYEVNDSLSGKASPYTLRINCSGSEIYAEKITENGVAKYVLRGSDYFLIDDEPKRLERSLNPFFDPYSYVFGKYILNNHRRLKDARRESVTFEGRKALAINAGDWLNPKREYEFIIDEETSMPLRIRIFDSGEEVFSVVCRSLEVIKKNSKTDLKVDTEKVKDVYAESRIEPSEAQSVAPFTLLVPSYIPSYLNQTQFLLLKEFQPRFTKIKIKGPLIAFNYYGNERFLTLIETRGSFPVAVSTGYEKLTVKNTSFKIVPHAGYDIVFANEKGILILMITNLEKDEISKVLRSMF